MLSRELVEELVSGLGAPGLRVLETLEGTFDGLPMVLTLPFEVIGQNLVEGVGGAFPASAMHGRAGADGRFAHG